MFDFSKDNEKKTKEQIGILAEQQKLYRRVFDTPEGHAVMEDLRKRCYVNITTLDSQPAVMGFKEGRRSIYVHIENMIDKDVNQMLEELNK